MTVTIEIPDDLAQSWASEDTDMARVVLENFAAESCRQGKITPFEVRQMLGHDSRWETQAFLSAHEAWPTTTLRDLEEGLGHLRNFPLPSGV